MVIKLSRPDRYSLLTLTGLSLLLWWPTRTLPYHWDSAAYVINAAQALSLKPWPIISQFTEFAHPPLIPFLVTLSWSIFGQNRLAAHLTVVPFLILLLGSTYYLGKKLSSPLTGLTAALLTASFPFLVAEVGMIYLDLPLAALSLAGLTAWFYQRPVVAAAFLSLAMLTKMTILPLILVLTVFTLLDQKQRCHWRWYLPLVLPLLCAGFYLNYHHYFTGWWLTLPGRETVYPKNLSQLITSLSFVFSVFFLRQHRFLLTFIGLAGVLKLVSLKKPTLTNSPFILLITLLVVGLGTFTLTGEFIPRYALSLVPLFTIITCHLLWRVWPSSVATLIFSLIFISFILAWHPPPPPSEVFAFRLNEDLSYQDHIQVGLTAAQYLESHYPQSLILGGFPQSYQLTQPLHSYVNQPLNFQDCQTISDLASVIRHPSPVILYIHPYHYSQIRCQEILQPLPHTLLETFQHNGIWAKLYLIDPNAK
ncbi:hypothetical protein A2W24_07050 [Microgenomates group bacterium RBG_16_45_19]|nr:MAG: hypothetical protein A2W24_07050 [Microgenomates group bacterium RBG_16_45_19]